MYRAIVWKKGLLAGLLAGACLATTTITCDVPNISFVGYPGDPYYGDDYYYEEPCCDDEFYFDGWFEWW